MSNDTFQNNIVLNQEQFPLGLAPKSKEQLDFLLMGIDQSEGIL